MNEEIKKYIFIGILNTTVTYFLSIYVYIKFEPIFGFITTGIIGSLICIKFTFWMQRLFVFKSKNKWYVEYLKSNISYAIISLISTSLMYLLWKILKINIWISQALSMPLIFILSYLINKKYTFKN